MNTMIIPDTRSRGLLWKCLAASLVVHAAALTYVYYYPMLLQGPLQSLFGLTAAKPSLLETEEETAELVQKNHVIEEVFQQIVVLSPHFQQPYDLAELPKGIALAPTREEAPSSMPSKDQNLAFSKPVNEYTFAAETNIQDMEEMNIPAIFTAPESGMPIASQLQIDAASSIPELPAVDVPIAGQGAYEDLMSLSGFSLDAAYETDYSLNLFPQLVSPDSLKIGEDLKIKTDSTPLSGLVTSHDLHLESEQVRSTLFIPKAPTAFLEKKEVQVLSAISDLDQYDFPAIANAAEWNDDFDVDVTFLPNPEGQGYIFSLSLKPNYDMGSHSLKQNLYFILDRSSSVQKHRFAVFKRGVLKALSSMQHGDTFNILVMDKKIARFSPENRPVTLKNIHAAEEFLDKQEAGGLFAASDIYTTLDKILPAIPENDEVHTAILLTDGKTGMSNERKQAALKKWIEKNNGKMALYACAIGRDNDLLSLDMLTSVSGGKLMYSDTHASFPRKLAKLVLDLRDPVAKDIMITAVPHNPNSHIEFYPANSHLSSLYGHQPYVVVGQIDDPCAFDLVIQGRHRDQWIAIKKNVSFVEGHKGDYTLEKEWNAQHANVCYSKFLKEGKASHLKEAKEILKKSRSEVAFE